MNVKMDKMSIPEAIEILTLSLTIRPSIKDPDYDNAVNLGIEAMKRIKDFRLTVDGKPVFLLPGETERS